MPQKNSVGEFKTHSSKVEERGVGMNNNKEQLNENEKTIREITEMKISVPHMEEIKVPFNVQQVWEKFESKLEKAVTDSKKIYYRGNIVVGGLMEGSKEDVEDSLKRICVLKKDEAEIKILQEYYIKQPINKQEQKIFREWAEKQIKQILGEDIEESISNLLTMEWLRFFETMYSQSVDLGKFLRSGGMI